MIDITRRTLVAVSAALATPGVGRAEGLLWDLPPLRKVQIDAGEIAYFEAGSGPPLVLLHGLSGSAAFEWGRVIGPLSKRFRVVAPYQIGFAPSGQPDLPYDARTFITALGGFMRALSIRRPTLLGESFGGWVVAQYAQAQGAKTGGDPSLPEIARLVVVDGAVGLRPSDQSNINAESINDAELRTRTQAFFRSQPPADNTRTRSLAQAAVRREPVVLETLSSRMLPTLVVWGREDQLLPLSIGQRLATDLKARFAVIKDCGHIPSVEQPKAFMRELLAFSA